MTPAREVGGDFYDFFKISEDKLAFLIADVSDKGIGSAVFMAITRCVIRQRALLGGSPKEVLSDVDRFLLMDNEMGMFVTVWMGYLDLATGVVTACNAGHDFPAMLRKEEGMDAFAICESEHGSPIAFWPDMEFPEITFTLQKGDRIFLYTDGVNEAMGKAKEEFGFDRMIEVLNEHKNESNEELCKAVKEAVDTFVGDAPQFDDMTMLGLSYNGR